MTCAPEGVKGFIKLLYHTFPVVSCRREHVVDPSLEGDVAVNL